MSRAVLCHENCTAEDLKLESVELSPSSCDLGPSQVLVEVRACGVNFPDVLMIQGKYQFQPAHPFSPGGEVSGVVAKVGSSVSDLKVGDHVACMNGWGGFAEYVVAERAQMTPVPTAIDFPVAAGMMMTYGTTLHALKQRAQLCAGETILVLGAAGGVGLATVELAKAMGATVIAAASSDEKLAVCKDFGADHVINYSSQDLRKEVKRITDGNGVDVVYDPVGDRYAEPAVRSLAWKGRYLVIGFAAGEIPKIPLNLLLLKGASIVGVFWGSFTSREPALHEENTRQLIDMVAKGQLRPLVSQRYPLSQAGRALRDMQDRKIKGKAVLIPDHLFAQQAAKM